MNFNHIYEYAVFRARAHYLAQDGLMALKKDEFAPPQKNTLDENTPANDNSVLFLAYFYIALNDKKNEGKIFPHINQRLHEILKSLLWPDLVKFAGRVVRPFSIFACNPGRTNRKNSHDNLLGVLFLENFYSTTLLEQYSECIAEEGLRTDFTYGQELYIPPQDQAISCYLGGYFPSTLSRIALMFSFLRHALWPAPIKPGGGVLKQLVRYELWQIAKKKDFTKAVWDSNILWAPLKKWGVGLETMIDYSARLWLMRAPIKKSFEEYFHSDKNHPIFDAVKLRDDWK